MLLFWNILSVLKGSTQHTKCNGLTVTRHRGFSKNSWFTRELFSLLGSVVCTCLSEKVKRIFKRRCEDVLLTSPNKCTSRCIKNRLLGSSCWSTYFSWVFCFFFRITDTLLKFQMLCLCNYKVNVFISAEGLVNRLNTHNYTVLTSVL